MISRVNGYEMQVFRTWCCDGATGGLFMAPWVGKGEAGAGRAPCYAIQTPANDKSQSRPNHDQTALSTKV
jgi:hypothetical protein